MEWNLIVLSCIYAYVLFFFLNSVLKSTAVRFDLSCMNQLVFIRFCLFYSGVEWSCYSERRAIYMNLTNWLHEW